MSCSMQAAHSSSRSSAPKSCRPASASPSNIERDSAHTCWSCSLSCSKRCARFSTDSARTSSNSSPSPSSRSKKMPSRSPASVTSIASNPPSSSRRGQHERAAQDHVGAVVLDALHLRPLRRRPRGQLLDQLLERLAGELEPLHVDVRDVEPLHRRGGEVADRPADADQPAAAAPPAELLELAGHVRAQRLHLLRARLLPRQEALAHAHRAERQGLRIREPPALDPHPLDAAAADVEPEPVLDRRGVGHCEPAVAGLLASADHAGLEPGGALDLGEQLGAVARVADRARRHRHHLLDPGGLAEGGEHRGGVKSAVHAVGRGALPRRPCPAPIRTASRISSTRLHQGVSGLVSEHHETPGVGPHVDDRNPLHTRDDAPQPQFRRAPMPMVSVMNATAQASAASISGPKLDNRRVLAALVDLGIVLAGTLVILFAADALSGDSGEIRGALGAVILGWALYYHFAMESGGGQTVGKKLMKLRVVLADGRPAGMREIAVRTVLRVVDSIGFYIVGLIVMLATGERRQRLGDLAAGTMVVDASATAYAPPAPVAVPVEETVVEDEAVEDEPPTWPRRRHPSRPRCARSTRRWRRTSPSRTTSRSRTRSSSRRAGRGRARGELSRTSRSRTSPSPPSRTSVAPVEDEAVAPVEDEPRRAGRGRGRRAGQASVGRGRARRAGRAGCAGRGRAGRRAHGRRGRRGRRRRGRAGRRRSRSSRSTSPPRTSFRRSPRRRSRSSRRTWPPRGPSPARTSPPTSR